MMSRITSNNRRDSQEIIGTQAGLSLIELMIVTAVTGILTALVLGFLSNQLVANSLQTARSVLLQEVQIALDVVNRDIKHAAGVDDINRWEDDYSPGAPDDLLSWMPTDNVLVIATPAKDGDGNFLYEDPFAYITHKNNLIYFVDNGVLYKRTLAADEVENAAITTCPAGTEGCEADIPLIHNVTDFDVRYFDANDEAVEPDEARSVSVTVTVTDTVYNRSITATYSIRSVFRNE